MGKVWRSPGPAKMNKVILFGRIGRDPANVGRGDTVIASFPMVTSGSKDRVTWHNVKSFNETAESVLKHLSKGRQVLVEGAINNYEYLKDGQTRYGSEIIAHRIQFVSSPKEPKVEECPF